LCLFALDGSSDPMVSSRIGKSVFSAISAPRLPTARTWAVDPRSGGRALHRTP
jgi:hypothetical protein